MGGRNGGRKPKPTLIRKLEGNRSHSSLPENEPEPKKLTPADMRPPDHLDAIGRNVWRRVLRAMPPGVITKADRETLEIYCDSYAQYRHAKDSLKKMGPMLVTPNGAYQTNPLVTQMRQWAAMTSRLASELGLTPAARPRLGASGADLERDDDDDWLKTPAKVVSVNK